MTFSEEVTLDYATGETYGQGKSGTALWGFEPRRSWLSQRAVFAREVFVSYATGRVILGE